jgi:CRP-like cAMP-binding protein
VADITAFKFGKNPPFDLLSKKEVFYRNDKEYLIYTRQKFLKQVFEEVISSSLFTKSSHAKPKEIEVAKEIDGRELEEAERTLLKIREKFDFFKNMDDVDVLSVTSDVHIVKLSKNETLFEQNSEGEEVFFIMRGFILISVEGKEGERVDLARLGQENIFGEMAPITKEKRSARATSLSDGTTVLSFKIRDEGDDENVKSFKTLYQNFTHILARKLINANKIIAKRRG